MKRRRRAMRNVGERGLAFYSKLFGLPPGDDLGRRVFPRAQAVSARPKPSPESRLK